MVGTSLLVGSEDSWIVDSDASVHIYNTVQGFLQTKSLNKAKAHGFSRKSMCKGSWRCHN